MPAPEIVSDKARLLDLPAVARLSLFARHPGAAFLITTEERLQYFDSTYVFGVKSSVNPEINNWGEKPDKLVLSIEHALKLFPSDLSAFVFKLELNQNYPRETLLAKLLSYGLERDNLPGVVVRGDTLSLYPTEDEEEVIRLEFFGDTLDTIEYQQNKLTSYTLTPHEDVELTEDSWDTRLVEHLTGKIFLDSSELFAGETEPEDLAWFWEYCATREVLSFGRDPLDLPERHSGLEPLSYYRGKLENFANDAEIWLQDNYSVHVLLRFERSGHYLQKKVIDNLENQWTQTIVATPGEISLSLSGNVRGGYYDPTKREVIISEDLLYAYQGTRKLRRLPGKQVENAMLLSVGDYLIHPEHGVGQFLGLEPRKVIGITRDYLRLKYAGEGKLYLPMEQLPLLKRHPGTTDTPPKLSTLGTNEWARAKEKARVNAQELATKLIKLYAQRQLEKGTPLSPLQEWDSKIAHSFPFELTPDQQQATNDVFADMAKAIPMDRLISGDVGFGKTEVAIRAAHRALGHEKQVAILVPTTILAQQHYDTFASRFKDLPVVVEMLSRFNTDSEAKLTLKGLKTGSVDLVIGTHRLLSEQVNFNDLGLLVIDEEHRFGVAQKERIKRFRANVDVLSLSATPIPRTLYMGLVGLRDVSQIMTPPRGRKPIKTILQPYDPNTIRDAVMFELGRGGKTFYIHDRIGSMGIRAMVLQKLIPEVRIGIAHGQMSNNELEKVMLAFAEGAYDMLLSTTIVESGLDIATANTLIVERADRLGLAQLYQLRGRVGRRETEAKAYLFYPGKLKERAQRRLFAISELHDLGSGHLLAERDMEIRGVGNLLGPEQHGHVNLVSLEVYTEMLAEEVAKLKGEVFDTPLSVAVDLSIDAGLPASYIADDNLRIGYYGQLAESTTLAAVSQITKTLRTRFGPLPEETTAFIELLKLRLLAKQKGIAAIKEHLLDVEISFHKDGLDNIDYDARGLQKLPYTIETTPYPPGFKLKKRGLDPISLLKAIADILYQCA